MVNDALASGPKVVCQNNMEFKYCSKPFAAIHVSMRMIRKKPMTLYLSLILELHSNHIVLVGVKLLYIAN
jgi:hypothetical protein